MPDFRVEYTASIPIISNPVWEDPASLTLPSRITGINNRQFRKVVVELGAVVTLSAILTASLVPESDATVGLFHMWALEFPTGPGGPPVHAIPTPGMTSVQTFEFAVVGHYTLVARHEDFGGAPDSAAGGAVLIHFEAEDPTP